MQGEPARAAEKAMQKERRGGGVLERERGRLGYLCSNSNQENDKAGNVENN